MKATFTIDPLDPTNHGKALWVVYGVTRFHPQIMCVKLLAYTKEYQLLSPGRRGHHVCVWGYSVWKRSPGFRMLGVDVAEWSKDHGYGPMFFDRHADALALLKRLTTPKCDS